jgi:hemoglobin/transferrin/lactoferrin receptor protein
MERHRQRLPETVGVAGGNDTIQGLFMYAHRHAHEMKNMGGDDSCRSAHRTEPQDVETAYLGKIVLNATPGSASVTYEHRDASSSTDMLRLSPSLPRVTPTAPRT